jgi:hypothetical protein
MNPAGRCPACGSLLPGRDRQRGGRRLRYCSGAHARATEIRQQIGELTAAMADTASGQQALFASPGAARRMRPADTAAALHRLVAELAVLATAGTVTKRVTFRRTPAGTETAPLFDEPRDRRK